MTYLDETADAIRASVPDGVDVPPDARDLFLAYAVLLRAKGPAVTASDVHDAWVAWMLTRDGEHPARDQELRQHRGIVLPLHHELQPR